MIDIKILEGTAHRIQSDYKNVVRSIYVNEVSDKALIATTVKVYVYFKDGTKITRIINENELTTIASLMGPTDIFYNLLSEMIETKMERMTINDDITDRLFGCHDTLGSRLIKKVIFNDPATIVFWVDGTKTVVKAHDEKYDPEKGLAMAIAKKHLGNQGNYYNTFTKWLPNETDEEIIEKLKEALKEMRAKSKANKKG